MQASTSTSTIAKFSRSFGVEHITPEHGENVKEKVAYSEFQAFGEPFACLGTVGDIYVDITSKNCALYAKFEEGWKKWPGPTQRTTPLHHPVHLTHVLWCKLDKKVLGWIPVKSLSRVLSSSSSHAISTILDSRRSVLQKHVKKQSKGHTLPPPTKKPRLDEPSASSAQADSLTDPVRNSVVNYWFSFPPFVDSIVTFIEKSTFPAMDPCASDYKPRSHAQHNATREARRSSKLVLTQNMQTHGLSELDDDFMAESQRLMNAIMGSTKGCPADAAVTEAPMHEAQLQNPPLEEPPAPRVPSPSYSQIQAQRSNSSGSSSTLSESGPVISLANPEPQRIPTTLETKSSATLPNSPIPAVKKLRLPTVSRKRSSWAMLDDNEVHRVGASSSALQIKPTPALGHELEHSKTTSSLSISTSVPFKKRVSAARKMPSPPELHASFSSSPPKFKGKEKASDVSSTPSTRMSVKEEQLPSSVGVEEANEEANQVLSSGSGLVHRTFDNVQPESTLAPQARQVIPTSSSSHSWKRLQQLPPSRLNSSPASSSTSISPSRFAVQHSKSNLTGVGSEHMPLEPVQRPAPVNSGTSAPPSSPSKKSPARKGKAIDSGAATNILAVRKRSPPPMDVEGVEETDNGWLTLGGDLPFPIDDQSHHPISRSPSSSANIKLEKRTSSPSPIVWPLETKKSQTAATYVSAPVALGNKRLGKALASSVSARAYPKQSRVIAEKGVLDLAGVDSDDDDVVEITADRKVKKYSSVIMSPTKFKVKGRDPPISSSKKQLRVMPKYEHRPDYKRKATVDREAKAKQQLKNELNKESVIDLTLASDEDEDDQINVKPLLLAKRAVLCGGEVEKQGVSVVKEEEEDVFGDIEMVDLTAPSRNNAEEIDVGLGVDVDMSNFIDINDGKGLEGDKDEDDKNDSGEEYGGFPVSSEDALEDGRNHCSPEEECVFSGSGEGDERMIKDLVPPLAHLPEPQSNSETGSSHTATEEEVDELKDEDDESEHEIEDDEDLRDITNLQLTNDHLRLLFDLDGKRYCRACLSHEPTMYWQVPPGSVELVSEQLMQHCISVHLQICEQFAALDHDELKEIERTVM